MVERQSPEREDSILTQVALFIFSIIRVFFSKLANGSVILAIKLQHIRPKLQPKEITRVSIVWPFYGVVSTTERGILQLDMSMDRKCSCTGRLTWWSSSQGTTHRTFC